MDHSKFRVMVTAADYGSFSKAAEIHGYTPSGVTHMMNALEKEFGFSVFHRTNKGVAVTDAGSKLLPVVRGMIKWDEQVVQTVAEIKGLETGTLVIGAYSSISSHWLPDVIHQFKNEHPGIDIQLLEGIHQEIDEWLGERRIDLALYSWQDHMDCDWIPLRDDPMLAILPLNHKYADAQSFPIEACQDETFIIPAMGRDSDVLTFFDKFGLSPYVGFSTLENYATMALVANDLGISVMNELITVGFDAKVVKIPLDPPQSIEMGIAVNSMAKASPATLHFIDSVRQYMDQNK